MDSTPEGEQSAQTRIRQQEVVAELGQRALETDDLEGLMGDATVAVAETLDTDYASVFEVLPGGDDVLLRQGSGWRDGHVGSATFPTGPDSQIGYTLRTDEPIVVDDLRTDERFSGPELLTGHDVVSAINVVIGAEEEPWGVLGTYATEQRQFTEYDVHFVRSVANVLASAIENEAAHSELQEIHDRITDGILSLNEAWEFTHVNRRAEEILGYDADELLGSVIWEVFPQVTGTEFESRYREAMASQEPVSFEAYYPPFDAWFEEHVYPSETGLSVYFRDVTEQKEMEAELEEVHGRISDAFYAIDDEWRFTFVNRRAEELLGRTADELVGTVVWDAFPEAEGSDLHDHYATAMERQERVSFERYSDPLGIWAHVDVYPSETGLSVYFRDVTEQKQMETELEEIYGRISDAFFALDEEWRFTYLNEHAQELINPEGRELVGENVWEEFPAATERQFKPMYEQAMYEQETVSFEEYYPEPLDRWFEVRAYPSSTGLSVYFRDVTERKRREREIVESEQRYRTLAECFPNGIVTLFDDDLRYTLAAGRAFDDLPVSQEDVEGRRPRELWGDAVADALEPALKAALDGEEQSVEVEYEDREWIVHAVPITDGEGDVFAGMTMAQDITERKTYQADLERALDLLEKTERLADVGGWEIDPDTMEVFWTDHIFELLEVTADEEPPLDEALAMYHEEDQPVVEGAVEEALESGQPFDIEVRIRTHDGNMRWLRLQGVPETADGEVVSLRGAAHDITTHKERESRLEEVIEKLEVSNERLEQFAYAASHDLQEPLRMVSSYLQLLEHRYEDQLDGDAEEFIEFAVDGAERMRAMIDALLAYSRIETQGDPAEPVDLDAVLVDVREDLQVKIEESNAELTVEELPRVEGDADQLRQVFQNLLDNAIEYSGDESPRIHVEAERREAETVVRERESLSSLHGAEPSEGDETNGFASSRNRAGLPTNRRRTDGTSRSRETPDVSQTAAERRGTTTENVDTEWVLSVRDEGVGIDSNHADRVFEVFERLHANDEHPGTGIGLALCERIVERHGGTIWVDSEPGEGATFSFTLPAADDHDA